MYYALFNRMKSDWSICIYPTGTDSSLLMSVVQEERREITPTKCTTHSYITFLSVVGMCFHGEHFEFFTVEYKNTLKSFIIVGIYFS